MSERLEEFRAAFGFEASEIRRTIGTMWVAYHSMLDPKAYCRREIALCVDQDADGDHYLCETDFDDEEAFAWSIWGILAKYFQAGTSQEESTDVSSTSGSFGLALATICAASEDTEAREALKDAKGGGYFEPLDAAVQEIGDETTHDKALNLFDRAIEILRAQLEAVETAADVP